MPSPIPIEIHEEIVEYRDSELVCEGYLAAPAKGASGGGKLPAILVAHAWGGQDDFARAKARALAELGYVGFAIDMYGKGRRGNTPEVCSALMQPFMDDRALLRRSMLAAVSAVRSHALVDAQRLAAIGFCFGGLCALDLARSGAPGVRGVVSFHGLLTPPNLGPQSPIAAKVLVLHGYDDPMAPPDAVLALAKELTDAGADWQIHAYGRTLHAFTNPVANAPEMGLRYDAAADRRSWAAMVEFLKER